MIVIRNWVRVMCTRRVHEAQVMRKFSILCSCNLYQQHFTLTLGHMNTIISTCSFIHSNCVLVRTWIKFFLVWKRRVTVHCDCRDGKHNSKLPIHPENWPANRGLCNLFLNRLKRCACLTSSANEAVAVAVALAVAVAGQRGRRGLGEFLEKMQT